MLLNIFTEICGTPANCHLLENSRNCYEDRAIKNYRTRAGITISEMGELLLCASTEDRKLLSWFGNI